MNKREKAEFSMPKLKQVGEVALGKNIESGETFWKETGQPGGKRERGRRREVQTMARSTPGGG